MQEMRTSIGGGSKSAKNLDLCDGRAYPWTLAGYPASGTWPLVALYVGGRRLAPDLHF